MPKGLASFLTQPEFFDLVRFVGELGKPGAYAVRSQPTIQRWRYLKEIPPELAAGVPDAKALAAHGPAGAVDAWLPAYARVDGTLPLADLKTDAGKVLYLSANIDVTEPGEIELKLDDSQGITAWIDDQPLADGASGRRWRAVRIRSCCASIARGTAVRPWRDRRQVDRLGGLVHRRRRAVGATPAVNRGGLERSSRRNAAVDSSVCMLTQARAWHPSWVLKVGRLYCARRRSH